MYSFNSTSLYVCSVPFRSRQAQSTVLGLHNLHEYCYQTTRVVTLLHISLGSRLHAVYILTYVRWWMWSPKYLLRVCGTGRPPLSPDQTPV